jgi:hypothetical protein
MSVLSIIDEQTSDEIKISLAKVLTINIEQDSEK